MERPIQNAKRFAIAVKSSARAKVRTDWQNIMKETPGLEVLGASSHNAAVEATDDAVDELRKKLGSDFYIEEEAPRQPL